MIGCSATTTARRRRGVMLLELIIALGILAMVGGSFATVHWQEQKLVKEYYYRAIAMQIVDGEMELLLAGEWKACRKGSHPYTVRARSAENLPAGRFVLTVGEMLSMPITNAIVAERAGHGSVGRYMGAYTLTFSTAFVIGPIAGTAIYQNLGPQVLWFGIGAIGVVLALAIAGLSRPLRARS